MALTRTELRTIASSVGDRTGWDFCRVRGDLDPVPWDYVSVVRQHLSPDVRALDIGTGGGEILLSLAAYLGLGIGVDAYPNMISAAQGNLRQKHADNTVFLLMRAEHLGFAPASFDVVLNRHAPVFPGEIVRVLRGSGVFITQHVGGRDTHNIYSAFG